MNGGVQEANDGGQRGGGQSREVIPPAQKLLMVIGKCVRRHMCHFHLCTIIIIIMKHLQVDNELDVMTHDSLSVSSS